MPIHPDIVTAIQLEKEFSAEFDEDAPGGALLVAKDGQARFVSAYGLADRDEETPLTYQHCFHLASVGKQFTGIGILILLERGKLLLDDPVGKYLPELKHYGTDFTIHRLLNHTSGIPDYYEDEDVSAALEERTETPSNRDALAVLADQEGPISDPGDKFVYSNPGYDLLGHLLERISGLDFPDFMEKNIFGPLGMDNTFSLPNARRRKSAKVAISYCKTGSRIEAYEDDPYDNLVGSGSIYSTVEDMLIYDEALYQGQLIKPSSLAAVFTSGKLNNGKETGYGFGWEISKHKGELLYSHTGSWLAFSTAYLRFPKQHICALALLNHDYSDLDPTDLATRMAEYFM